MGWTGLSWFSASKGATHAPPLRMMVWVGGTGLGIRLYRFAGFEPDAGFFEGGSFCGVASSAGGAHGKDILSPFVHRDVDHAAGEGRGGGAGGQGLGEYLADLGVVFDQRFGGSVCLIDRD